MTDRELLTLRTRALDRVVDQLDEARTADIYTVARQFWRFDVAIKWAHVYSRLSGKRFTVRRYGTTNSGRPIWEIRPVA